MSARLRARRPASPALKGGAFCRWEVTERCWRHRLTTSVAERPLACSTICVGTSLSYGYLLFSFAADQTWKIPAPYHPFMGADTTFATRIYPETMLISL